MRVPSPSYVAISDATRFVILIRLDSHIVLASHKYLQKQGVVYLWTFYFPVDPSLPCRRLRALSLHYTLNTSNMVECWTHSLSRHTEAGFGHEFYMEDSVEKYPWDSRDYDCIRLQNGLRAMLVKERRADHELSLCMTINVGDMHDPVRVFVVLPFIDVSRRMTARHTWYGRIVCNGNFGGLSWFNV